MGQPRLYAISDLHVRHKANRAAVERIGDHPGDWLILAGDVCERADDLAFVLDTLGPRFERLLWVPGNHELWSSKESELGGVAKYDALVALCRERGVLTPEDPYVLFPFASGPVRIALLFLLYDYTFAPPGMDKADALAWASEAGIMCLDEVRLGASPFPSREDWAAARMDEAEVRLAAEHPDLPTVLVNHWPLRFDLVRIPAVPRFAPWCGSLRTEDWHRRWNARVVVSGHLHVRATDWRDGVRFEEVSLGYPRHWNQTLAPDVYLRPILPGPAPPPEIEPDPRWHHQGRSRRRRGR